MALSLNNPDCLLVAERSGTDVSKLDLNISCSSRNQLSSKGLVLDL
jgi:hypothetical protein